MSKRDQVQGTDAPCGDKPHNKKLNCAQAENHGQAFLLLLAPV